MLRQVRDSRRARSLALRASDVAATVWQAAGAVIRRVPDPGPALPATVAGGTVGTLLVAVGGTFGGSPFDLRQPGVWFFGMTPDSGAARVLGAAALYAGVTVTVLAWLQLIRLVRARPGLRLRVLAVVFALWAAPLLVAPPMFSRDAYSYTAQGQMASEGFNPYDYGPVVLADPTYVLPVSPIWRNTAAPYGPLFIDLSSAAVSAAGHDEAGAVELLRLAVVAAVALAGVAIADLARGAGRAPAVALTLSILNPITLFDLISPGHNDALMLGLLAAALALARRRHTFAAAMVCALAAAIKVPALIGVVYVGWEQAGVGAPWRRKAKSVGGCGLIALATIAVVSMWTGLGSGWILSLGAPATVHSLLTPTTQLSSIGHTLIDILNVGPSGAALLTLLRAGGLLTAALVCLWLLWRSDCFGATHFSVELCIALSLLAVVALGPIVQPWYLAWSVIFLAVVPGERWFRLLVAVSVCAVLFTVPDFESLLASLGVAGALVGLALVVAVFASTHQRAADGLETLVPEPVA